MAKKIVSLADAREQKKHERREGKVEDLRQRFTKAMGMEQKEKNRFQMWRQKRKKKTDNKPENDGW